MLIVNLIVNNNLVRKKKFIQLRWMVMIMIKMMRMMIRKGNDDGDDDKLRISFSLVILFFSHRKTFFFAKTFLTFVMTLR